MAAPKRRKNLMRGSVRELKNLLEQHSPDEIVYFSFENSGSSRAVIGRIARPSRCGSNGYTKGTPMGTPKIGKKPIVKIEPVCEKKNKKD